MPRPSPKTIAAQILRAASPRPRARGHRPSTVSLPTPAAELPAAGAGMVSLAHDSQLTPSNAGDAASAFEEAIRAAHHYARASRAKSTLRAYAADWRAFVAWCDRVQRCALPALPQTVCAFLASEANDEVLNVTTLTRRLCAIRLVHLELGLSSPHDHRDVVRTLKGIRNEQAQRPSGQKAPALSDDVKRMIDAIDLSTLQGLRDRALLAFGFASAMRRSELVALNIEHIAEEEQGLRVRIARSKTDQEGAGQLIAIPRAEAGSPYCPVEALRAWLGASGASRGPAFSPLTKNGKVRNGRLTAQSVALRIKAIALQAGLNPTLYAGHSLRSGFLTSAAKDGASIFKMAAQSRHKSLTVLQGYVRDAKLFEDHALGSLLDAPKG